MSLLTLRRARWSVLWLLRCWVNQLYPSGSGCSVSQIVVSGSHKKRDIDRESIYRWVRDLNRRECLHLSRIIVLRQLFKEVRLKNLGEVSVYVSCENELLKPWSDTLQFLSDSFLPLQISSCSTRTRFALLQTVWYINFLKKLVYAFEIIISLVTEIETLELIPQCGLVHTSIQ